MTGPGLHIITDVWLLSELSIELKVNIATVRGALDTWDNHGVIREDLSSPESKYILVERTSDIPASSGRTVAPRHGMFFFLSSI